MYGVYHGADGIKSIASNIHGKTKLLAQGLETLGYEQLNETYFDTLKVVADAFLKVGLKELSEQAEINLRYFDEDFIGISLNEAVSLDDIIELLDVFAKAKVLPRPLM